MSLNFFFPEKSPAADVDNAESPRGQPAKSGTTWQPRRSILVSSHGREREDKLGFEGEKREGKRVRKESGGGSGWRAARGERRARGEGERTSGEREPGEVCKTRTSLAAVLSLLLSFFLSFRFPLLPFYLSIPPSHFLFFSFCFDFVLS